MVFLDFKGVINLIANRPVGILAGRLGKFPIVVFRRQNILPVIHLLGKRLIGIRRIGICFDFRSRSIVTHSLANNGRYRQARNDIITDIESQTGIQTILQSPRFAQFTDNIKRIILIARRCRLRIVCTQITQICRIISVLIIRTFVWIRKNSIYKGIYSRSVVTVLADIGRNVQGKNQVLDGTVIQFHQYAGIRIFIGTQDTVLLLEIQ